MSLIDDIKRDREGATPEPWEVIENRPCPGWVEVVGPSFTPNAPTIATDLTQDDWTARRRDARRIARVPDMEAALLAAEELAALLEEYRRKVPLGHQPHMIAHRADNALATYRKATRE